MSLAITEGLILAPPRFASGLAGWSQGTGLAGTPSYEGASNAALVSADADFGACLELVKTSATQRLRAFMLTPLRTGLYLRLTVRIKMIAGALPTARISCLPVGASGALTSLPGQGVAVPVVQYGSVMVLSAIIGSGARQGVDLAWGTASIGAHLGIELTGPNGGTLRIENFTVEDVTSAFHHQMLGLTDVRDYGARGDGSTNDLAAFQAADLAALAAGRKVFVPAGAYAIGGNLTLSSPVSFEGTLVMDRAHRLALTRNFNIEAYSQAFGSEEEGFKRGMQALFYNTDHISFDLCGRAISLTEPLFVAENAGLVGESFAQRRVVDNGQLVAAESAAWVPGQQNSWATYNISNPYQLTGVDNVAHIEVGSRVSGPGICRETYVRAKNVSAGTLDLSLPPGSQNGRYEFSFRRFRYMLDFTGFSRLDRFEMSDVELQANGRASCVMLPVSGITTWFQGCVFNRPLDRAITSIGTGCQGMMLDECQFLSNEQAARAQDRHSIALNVNANDVKVRDNRAVRFRHFAVMHGSGHMFVGNHWFQGDSESPGVRTAGVVLTGINVKTLVTGNYVDNSFIELSNEREINPVFSTQFSFGGLTLTGNIFTANDVVSAFSWIVVTPYGPGHYLQGLSITGNTFRTLNGAIDRAEKVDTTYSNLDYSRFRNLTVQGNNFNGVNTAFQNPLTLRHSQNSDSTVWTVGSQGFLPFQGWARMVAAVQADGVIRQGSTPRYDLPSTEVQQGADSASVNLRWPVACRGQAWITLRCDNPV